MQFVNIPVVVYQDVLDSASNVRFLKCNFGGQIVKKNCIDNTCCFHTDKHGMFSMLHLLDLSLDCSRGVLIQPLLVARW